jgi:hypothetical protein
LIASHVEPQIAEQMKKSVVVPIRICGQRGDAYVRNPY